MPAKADRIEDLYIAEKGNVSSMAEKKIGEIKEELKAVDDEKLPSFIETYEKDERSGVVKIVEQAKKRIEKLEAEKLRIEYLKKYEREYADCGYICGIDEVGRGPLAGPVVTAAVILPEDCAIAGINDSKKLTAGKREELSAQIKEKAVAYSFGSASPVEIDEINILQATYRAMRRAIEGLKIKPDFLLADAVTIPGIEIPQKGIVHGDAKSITIGAASIIAKVERDAMMSEYEKVFGGYGFERNKGYGSAEHISALKELGPCPIHRRSFIKNFI